MDFKFEWTKVWDVERARKEANLIWQLWYRAIAVNLWRGKISVQIDRSCPMCQIGEDESVLHRFWCCEASQQLWRYTTDLLYKITGSTSCRPWQLPNWKQSLFATELPRKFQPVQHL
jgi:hypothetical protein